MLLRRGFIPAGLVASLSVAGGDCMEVRIGEIYGKRKGPDQQVQSFCASLRAIFVARCQPISAELSVGGGARTDDQEPVEIKATAV